MKIAIASGKGGTGKTTVALGFAASFDQSVTYADCDVEEPNAHLFLKPKISDSQSAYSFIPLVDERKCSLCGECENICSFSAIIIMGKKVVTYPEMCHGCRGCELVCPEKAISPGKRELGSIIKGKSGNISLIYGNLRVGEAMSPPLIKQLKERFDASEEIIILDSPPGASCPMVSTVRDADFVVLVTEPTPFGINDLSIAFEALKQMGRPCGLVINRSVPESRMAHDFAEKNDLPVLLEIPDDRKIAEGYSRGMLITQIRPDLKASFKELLEKVVFIAAARRKDS